MSQSKKSVLELKALLKTGRRFSFPLFDLVIKEKSQAKAKLWVIVAKKVSGKAVERNRVKRLIKEAHRHCGMETAQTDLVFIAKPGIVNTSFSEMVLLVQQAFGKIRPNEKVSVTDN